MTGSLRCTNSEASCKYLPHAFKRSLCSDEEYPKPCGFSTPRIPSSDVARAPISSFFSFVQCPIDLYRLIGEHRYGAQPTSQDARLRAFYESVELPDGFLPGCVDVQLEGEAAPLHMSRHLIHRLEYMHGKTEFHAETVPIEFMPGVRRNILKLLIVRRRRV